MSGATTQLTPAQERDLARYERIQRGEPTAAPKPKYRLEVGREFDFRPPDPGPDPAEKAVVASAVALVCLLAALLLLLAAKRRAAYLRHWRDAQARRLRRGLRWLRGPHEWPESLWLARRRHRRAATDARHAFPVRPKGEA